MKEPPRSRLVARYTGWLERWRIAILVAAVGVVVLGALLASRMPLRSDLSNLLPPGKQSVQDLKVLQQRARAFGNVLVMVEGATPEARKQATDQLLVELRRIDARLVSDIVLDDRGVARWIWRNRFVFAELSDLEAARDALAARIDRAKLEANPLYIELDEQPAEPDDGKLTELRQRLASAEREANQQTARISKDGTAQLIELKATFASSNVALGRPLMAEVRAAIAEVSRTLPGATFSLAGSVNISILEQQSVIEGMALAAGVTVLLCFGAMFLYYRAVLPILALLGSLLVGLAGTFVFAALAIGHLNLLSAFLTAIVIGNGINAGIIYLSRLVEELRAGRPAAEAVGAAAAGAARGTLAATLTASVAYGALIVTDFRGFRHFGMIGGAGMLLCWASAYTVLPAALLVIARRGWLRVARPAALGGWLARLAPTRPRPVILAGVAASVVATVITVVYIARDPFATNWRDLQSDSAEIEAQHRVDARMSARFERDALGGGSYRLVFAVPTHAAVDPLVAALRGARDRRGEPLFTRIHWYDELVPRDQERKLGVLGELRRLLDDPGVQELAAEERADLARVRPPDDLRPVTAAEVPKDLAWPFVEQDGSVGRLVFAWGAPRFQTWDVADRVEFSRAVRGIGVPAGTAIGGESLVIADIVETLERDAPLMSIVALVGAIVGVWLVVGLRRHGLITVACGVAGVLLMIAVCALIGLRVHFLDLVALPITIGIGIDYAVNLAARDRDDRGTHDARQLLATSGAAVVLCSYTTMVGYGSLLLSSNGGIRAFGIAAIIGEVTCLAMALWLAPSLLAVTRRATPGAAAPRAAE